MYTLKSIVRRGSALGAAVAVFAAAIVPAAPVFADALNPLTERSLLLSSSAPGWQNTDGSGNSEGSLNANGQTFAVPGSGPNGQKTGETFSFNVSTDSSVSGKAIQGMSLQYCTKAAGLCKAPGDNANKTNAAAMTAGDDTSDLEVVGSWTEGAGAGQFQVFSNGSATTGWAMTHGNVEDASYTPDAGETGLTGKNNFIRLVNTGTTVQPTPGQSMRVIFRPSTSAYITNPGSGAFFVKMNTYNTDDSDLFVDEVDPATNPNLLDGGVTVANVMTDSIHITTKVLETMSFSVGTQNRDTVDIGTGQVHGKCDAILTPENNRLQLGNQNAEFSLETDKAYDVESYWRLSSNSSGGATVYYSGNTLANTVGDEIAEMPNEVVSTPGTEQFGLGFINAGSDTLDTGAATWASGYLAPNSYPFRTLTGQATTGGGTARDFTLLTAQSASNAYDEAAGSIFTGNGQPGTAKFKFLKSSSTVPELIAQQNQTVISCATAKMRYVANIGADTPAGVYTTKINYLAAPQY